MVHGVTHEFSKKLEINGVGYRAEKKGEELVMKLGYSHDVIVKETADVKIDVPDANHIVIHASTSRRSASLPPMCATSVLPSRTRARASSMRTSTSAAKKARPALNKGRCA